MTNKSKKILSEISAGELLDKISILEIKLDKIKNNNDQEEISKEYKLLKEPYSCAILGFTLNTGAYSSEIFRSAFETINKGILEAARGLGFNKIHTFFKIKLPIAIRQCLPAYGNEMILLLKGTSLASTVTLLDLTGVAKHIISTTFRPVEVFIVAGSIYLIMTFIIHNLIKYLEKKFSY